jgi:hypothetical protein
MVKMATQQQTYTAPVAASHARLSAYLRSLPQRHVASEDVVCAAERLWDRIHDALPGAPVPNCVPIDDGGLRFSWIQGDRYVDAEITSGERYEWFFRDRAADSTDDGDAAIDGDASELLSHLRKLYS